MAKQRLIHSEIDVHGTLEAKHKFLMWIYFDRTNKILIQAFQDYPNGEYIDSLRDSGAVIKIVPINKI